MIDRALAAGVPFAWVAADTVYGVGEVEMKLRRARKGYVLGIASKHPVRSWSKPQMVCGTAEAVARDLPDTAWMRLSAGEGTKGARLHDWCYIELADLDPAMFAQETSESGRVADARGNSEAAPDIWTRGLMIRRRIADGEMAFFSTWCPAGTPIETLVAVEGRRWAIEDSFETAKNEIGLDQNETRSWHGWHRHVSLVMLVFAMMATIRHHANAHDTNVMPPQKTSRRAKPSPHR